MLAGGRSSRMGAPKAALSWHGSTLLRRVAGIAARAVDGPVIVVRAPGQELPSLPAGVEVATDAREGRGPIQGLAAGLETIGERAEVAYVSSTDAPLLHPAFIGSVVRALSDDLDVALPTVGGHRQPLAAAYRVSLLQLVLQLVAADLMKPAFLFERCRVRLLDERDLLSDPDLARGDPRLRSVANLNERADYERALALPAPEVGVRLRGALATASGPVRARLGAWSLGELSAAVGVTLDERVAVELNSLPTAPDPELPLVCGDAVMLTAQGAGPGARAATS